MHIPTKTFLSRLTFYGIGIASLFWLLLRSGMKPSRLAYPCQRTAAAFGLNFLSGLSPWLGANILAKAFSDQQVQGDAKANRHSISRSVLHCMLVLSPILFLSPGNPSWAVLAVNPPAAAQRFVNLPERPDPNPTVAIISQDHTPDEGEITTMVEQAIAASLGPDGLSKVVKNGDVVLVKPNLGCGYNSYETTDWRVVKPIVQEVKQAGASQVYIGEGEGCGYGLGAFDGAGYTANITDVTYVNFNDIASNPYYDVSVNGGFWKPSIAIPQVYFDADVVISVPKLKTHNEAGVTLSLKNAMGVPPVPLYSSPGSSYRDLIHQNYEIRKTIAQINLAKQPDFAVIDAILAGQGEGPWAADPIEVDAVLAGRDLVALDAVGAAVMGIDPRRIPYLVYASEKNLGILDLVSIRIAGTPIAAVKKNFSLPSEAATIYRKATVLQRTTLPIAIDGSLADWNLIEPVGLNQHTDIISDTNGWDGPQDLGVESRFLYDANALYAMIQVRDEKKVEGAQPSQVGPQGDWLELDVSVADPWYRMDKPEYGDDDFRFRVGYGPNPQVWDVGRGQPLITAQVKLVDSEDGYLIELRLPFGALNHFVPAENKQIGLDFSVMDVDGGTGETKMAWSGGVDLPEDVRLMGVGLLGPQRGCINPQTSCVFMPIQF